MSFSSPARSLSPSSVSPPTVAVVAPGGDSASAARYTGPEWASIAVSLSPEALPPAHRARTAATGHREEIRHDTLRRTACELRARQVGAIVPGSGPGVGLAEQLAHMLGIAGNLATTSVLRTDRAVQAAALRDSGLAAPRGLHTGSLTAALRWAELRDLPAYALAAADSAVTAPPAVCTSTAEIRSAWPRLRAAALHESGSADLVIQEVVPGQQFVAHTVSVPGSGQRAVVALWSELRTGQGVHGRSDLVDTHSVLGRALLRYAGRALDVLGVRAGAARCRIAFSAEHGPTLLSAQAFARTTPVEELVARATGIDHVRATVQAVATGRLAPSTRAYRHVSRVSLVAPRDGFLDGRLLGVLDSLPTVVATEGALTPGARVRRTVDRATCPGVLVLAAASREAIERDYRAIRALERLGLYGDADR
ncbi:hypothetical protein [Streptomyces sp. YS-3]|uniref:hypothetical protein n=1 Tax=Streptomyces sp. YS-3 TaxID=3381352 RepID=UPI003862B1F0